MMTRATDGLIAPTHRLRWLEDPVGDFPFYNGAPVALSGRQWLIVLAAVAMGFLALGLPLPWPGGAVGALLPAIFFALFPLAALAWMAPMHWRSLFGHVGSREVRLMVGFALLNIVVTMTVGGIVRALVDVAPNPANALLSAMDTQERVTFFIKTMPQLFGEELVTILPFLALLHLLWYRLGMGRRGAIVGAWLISSLLFGLIHLPTYDWNVIQCIFIIGSARLVLTLPWILTKNIWVSTGAHIINDWLLLSLVLLGAGFVDKA